MKGQFISFYLPYIENGHTLSSESQAERILSYSNNLLSEKPYNGIAITYSANYDQTITINKCYSDNNWYTGTNGANQASVIYCMEQLILNQYKALKYKIRIAPITTMSYTGFHGKTHLEIIKEDILHISELIKSGWCVLGWKNQVSSPDYAIGGGIADLSSELHHYIQEELKSLEKASHLN